MGLFGKIKEKISNTVAREKGAGQSAKPKNTTALSSFAERNKKKGEEDNAWFKKHIPLGAEIFWTKEQWEQKIGSTLNWMDGRYGNSRKSKLTKVIELDEHIDGKLYKGLFLEFETKGTGKGIFFYSYKTPYSTFYITDIDDEKLDGYLPVASYTHLVQMYYKDDNLGSIDESIGKMNIAMNRLNKIFAE